MRKEASEKKSVVFLGSKPIGLQCLSYLNDHKEQLGISLNGVLTNNNSKFGIADIESYCLQHEIRLLKDLGDLENIDEIDYLISIQYHQILGKEHILLAKKLAMNLHMAPLPEYRGCNQFTFAILDERGEFGATIHQMEEGIDSGAIIEEIRFKIPDKCFVSQLYNLTVEASYKMFRDSIANIINGQYDLTPQTDLENLRDCSIHYRNEIDAVKQIDLSWEKSVIEKYIRATYMEGFPPPYSMVGGLKVEYHVKL